jgi:hypothetical protein
MIEGIKPEKNDPVAGSGLSVVIRSITVTPYFAAVLRQNACILTAR